jgi:hypothetical protein
MIAAWQVGQWSRRSPGPTSADEIATAAQRGEHGAIVDDEDQALEARALS